MKDHTPSESLPLAMAQQIDRLCDRFEDDWSGPRRPRIEDYLVELSGAGRPAALRALMELELALRQVSGDQPTAEEYRERFPEYADQVASAFESTSMAEAPAAEEAEERPAIDQRDEPEGRALGSSLRFRILREHARGGLGRVSLALDRELGREVALKEIRLERADDPGSRARFLREAAITGRLEHPGIVPIYALGRYRNGRPYYAMRFVEGESLREAIEAMHQARRPGEPPDPLALRRLLRAFVDVCNVVAYAHSRLVVHRDLKPSNVMLGPFGETLVVDWGLAKALDDGPETGPGEVAGPIGSPGGTVETLADSVIGTPAYMSPEQAAGLLDRVGPPSDIYSLGGMLQAILVGRPPGLSASPPGERRPHPPRRIDPWVPRALEAVCLKAMAELPEDRYALARDLAGDVERWLADEPVSAMPEPLTDRARRLARRNRALVGSAAAALVVSAVALGVLAARERASNQQLRQERDRASSRYQLAKEVVDGFREVVEENLDVRDRPDLASVRTALLRQPVDYYRRLLNELESDNRGRPRDLEELADAHDALASLAGELDTLDSALRVARQAVSLRRNLALLRPDARRLEQLAHSLNQLANQLAALNRPDEAIEVLDEALDLRRSLVRDEPDNPEFRADLARLLINIAGRRSERGEFQRSDDALDEALAVIDSVGAEETSLG
jgi:serine/threonine-protein kinase